MTNFAGHVLPLEYAEKPTDSHKKTRSSSSLFDVSHMKISSIPLNYTKQLQYICTSNVEFLLPGQAIYSLFLNTNGGIVDDAIITRLQNSIQVVTNASTSTKITKYLAQNNIVFANVDKALVSLQGPHAKNIISSFSSAPLPKFMHDCEDFLLGGFAVGLSRCGYTGEDGFEIRVSPNDAVPLTQLLLTKTSFAGLIVRDTLRLEAGLALYGQDIDENVTPVEAGLSWTIAKEKKEAGMPFIGSDVVLGQIRNGNPRFRRVGVTSSGPPPRPGCKIYNDGVCIGHVTSGGPSPTLGGNIAMGFVDKTYKSGTVLQVLIREKLHDAVVTRLPFVPHKYYKVKKLFQNPMRNPKTHMVSEQKRRENIRIAFKNLSNLLPKPEKSENAVLMAAYEYIVQLEQEEKRLLNLLQKQAEN